MEDIILAAKEVSRTVREVGEAPTKFLTLTTFEKRITLFLQSIEKFIQALHRLAVEQRRVLEQYAKDNFSDKENNGNVGDGISHTTQTTDSVPDTSVNIDGLKRIKDRIIRYGVELQEAAKDAFDYQTRVNNDNVTAFQKHEKIKLAEGKLATLIKNLIIVCYSASSTTNNNKSTSLKTPMYGGGKSATIANMERPPPSTWTSGVHNKSAVGDIGVSTGYSLPVFSLPLKTYQQLKEEREKENQKSASGATSNDSQNNENMEDFNNINSNPNRRSRSDSFFVPSPNAPLSYSTPHANAKTTPLAKTLKDPRMAHIKRVDPTMRSRSVSDFSSGSNSLSSFEDDKKSGENARRFWEEMDKMSKQEGPTSPQLGKTSSSSPFSSPKARSPLRSDKNVIYSPPDSMLLAKKPSFFDRPSVSKSPFVELWSSPLIGPPFGDWKVEATKRNFEWENSWPLILPPYYQEFYYYNFYGKDHKNYLGIHNKLGPIIVSALPTLQNDKDALEVLIRTERLDHRSFIYVKRVKGKIRVKRELLTSFPDILMNEMSLKKSLVPDIQEELLQYERKQINLKTKIGILLCLEGQTKDDEMFSNTKSTPELEAFLDIMGDKVELLGFEGYNGGLDIKRKSTGEYSRYTKYRDVEVMFHVSTYLPHFPDDLQQVERKRHIGNNVVNIVFKQGNTPVSPTFMATQFTHVFAFVQPITPSELGIQSPAVGAPVKEPTHYRVSICSKRDVPPHTPFLPHPTVFHKDDLREFLMVKLLNAETACLAAPIFSKKLERTRRQLLDGIIKDFLPPSK